MLNVLFQIELFFLLLPSLMHETEHSKPVHWDNPEGWDGEGGKRGIQDGELCTPVADSCQCMAKPTIIL